MRLRPESRKVLCVPRAVRVKPGTGLPPADRLPQDARGLPGINPIKNKTGGSIPDTPADAPQYLKTARARDLISRRRSRPSDGKGRCVVGSLLDDASTSCLRD